MDTHAWKSINIHTHTCWHVPIHTEYKMCSRTGTLRGMQVQAVCAVLNVWTCLHTDAQKITVYTQKGILCTFRAPFAPVKHSVNCWKMAERQQEKKNMKRMKREGGESSCKYSLYCKNVKYRMDEHHIRTVYTHIYMCIQNKPLKCSNMRKHTHTNDSHSSA